MANRFFVLVIVFAAVVQASCVAALDIESAKRQTFEVLNNSVNVFIGAVIAKKGISLHRWSYVQFWQAGVSAFAAATPEFTNKQTLVNQAVTRYQNIADLIFGALDSVRILTRGDFMAINADLNKTLHKIPVMETVNNFFVLAGSKAGQNQAVDHLTHVFAAQFVALQSLLANRLGIIKTLDVTSTKKAALVAMQNFVDAIYAAVRSGSPQ